MNLKKLAFVLKRRWNRRYRLLTASMGIFALSIVLIFCLTNLAPRTILTLGGKYSVLTPDGFKMGQNYDFSVAAASNGLKELELPRPDSRTILFKYPDAVKLGRPAFLGSEISQSVDFTIADPPANGLIQIWVLTTSLEDFLEASKNFSTVEYLSFDSKNEKKGSLPYTLWNYTFKSDGKTIRGLEAFFDDKPYMYRISMFITDKLYNEKSAAIFDAMVQSVTVK